MKENSNLTPRNFGSHYEIDCYFYKDNPLSKSQAHAFLKLSSYNSIIERAKYT